jgi:hypothetical protein
VFQTNQVFNQQKVNGFISDLKALKQAMKEDTLLDLQIL